MSAPRPPSGKNPARRGGRARTDGSPRLVAPGKPGNAGRAWAVVWSEAGRSRRISTGESDEGRAKDFLIAFLNDRAASQAQEKVRDVIDAYETYMLAEHKHHKRARSVTGNLRSALKPIREHFGALAPETVRPAYVTKYTFKRREQGVGDRTISLELSYLRAALRRALDEETIASMPKIKLPQARSRARTRVLSPAELVTLLEAIKAPETPLHLRTFVALSLYTGQRGLHVRSLLWRDVDADTLYFTRSNKHAADNKQCADVTIIEPLRPYLDEAREVVRSPFVVEYKDAGVISVKKAWSSLTKRANLTDLNVHDLRRSFATFGRIIGMSLSDISDLMNLDEDTLRKHYAHGASERMRALVMGEA